MNEWKTNKHKQKGFSPVMDGFYREIESWAAYLPTYVSIGNQ